MTPAPIAVALDGPNLETITHWAGAAGPYVSTMKVGLETYLRDGDAAVQATRAAARGRDIFLDLKLHDIPHTVEGAARSVAHLHPAYLTVHASGGPAMVRAAAETLPDTKITAVTVLTSLSEADLALIGLLGPALDAVRRLAVLAVGAGARAIVCSPHEVAAVRAEVPADITLITPGVRPAAQAVDLELRDLKRRRGDDDVALGLQDVLDVGEDLLALGRGDHREVVVVLVLVVARLVGAHARERVDHR